MRATVEIDGPAVMARVHKVIDDGRRFYEELLASNGVLRVHGHARFRDGALVVVIQDGVDFGTRFWNQDLPLAPSG